MANAEGNVTLGPGGRVVGTFKQVSGGTVSVKITDPELEKMLLQDQVTYSTLGLTAEVDKDDEFALRSQAVVEPTTLDTINAINEPPC
jgi:hypothetical protein